MEQQLIEDLEQKKLPYLLVYNKYDLLTAPKIGNERELYVSAKTGDGIETLKEKIATIAKGIENEKKLVADLIAPNDVVILVTPIDTSAPKGRLILPQQQTIRDILEVGGIPMVCQDTELLAALSSLKYPPKLVITDSQAFGRVNKLVPKEIPLTSFSILFARYKGDLSAMVEGAAILSKLKDGDTVLISEGCTHHRQCGDIGSEKLPKWIREYTRKELKFAFTSGGEFPEDLSSYALVIHCGGCMLNEREMKFRLQKAMNSGVPMTNYGTTIAHVHGMLRRSLEPFGEIAKVLE